MSAFDATTWSANDPLDPADDAALADIRRHWEALDPVPADLVERVRFAVALSTVDTELLRLIETESLAAVRGDERTRLITFGGDTMTIMVNVSPNDDGSARLDGWLSPPAACAIELRTSRGPLRTEADGDGRFALAAVPAGGVQLVATPPGSGRTVTTPAFSV